jgi:hypothetical protein
MILLNLINYFRDRTAEIKSMETNGQEAEQQEDNVPEIDTNDNSNQDMSQEGSGL